MPVFGFKTQPGYRYHMAMATQQRDTGANSLGWTARRRLMPPNSDSTSKHQQINICASRIG
jgi:hypothetical protein